MWNQNSDNKNDTKKDETVVTTTAQAQAQQHHLPTSSSTSAGNGKTTKLSGRSHSGSGSRGGGGVVGGGVDKSNNFGTTKDKDNCSEASAFDSGFHSGPQLAEDYDDDQQHEGKNPARPSVQLNIVKSDSGSGNTKSHSKKQESATTDNYLDSGCINEDIEDDDEEVDIGEVQSNIRPAITTTAASPQQRVAAGNSNQMLLEQGVDSGVSEWFCKLTLRDPNQQVNNLGATNNENNNTGNAEGLENLASWEIYYQQNNEGDTQLHLVCMTGHVDVVAALIRMAPHPCLFNIQNDEAQTSLHLAVIYGQPKILRMLLIAGADPTVRDRHGNTPLHLACIAGDIQCVRALTVPICASEINEAHRFYGHLSSDKTTSNLHCARLPADLEIRNYDGERCVHLAAQGGHIDILRHLVYYGVDINAREGKAGRSPLHIAIECCNEVLANFLLEECSTLNIETPTYAGLTAFQVACILGNPTMKNHLEKSGAQTLNPPDSDYDSSDIDSDLDDSQMYNRFGDRYFAHLNGGGNPINVA